MERAQSNIALQMEKLPPDCLRYVSDNLAAADLVACGGVCHVLRDTIKSSLRWKRIVRENRLRVYRNQTAFEVVVQRLCQSCRVQRPAKLKPFCSQCLSPPSRVWRQLFWFNQVRKERQRRLLGVITTMEANFLEACGISDRTTSACDRVLEVFASRLATYPTFRFKATKAGMTQRV